MPLSKKIEWILQYYGIWIVVAVAAIVVLCSFLHSVFYPDPVSDICIMLLSDDYVRDDIPVLEQDIQELTGKTVTVEVYNLSELYGNGAFTIKLISDQIDLVIAPKEQTDSMVESEYLESFERIGDKDSYLGIPARARKCSELDKTIDYFKEREQK